MTSRFVVLEGGDGAGKSVQVLLLAKRLGEEGEEVVTTFEPGATAAGAVVRELVLHRSDHVTPLTEALLMAADRAQHVEEVIVPALAREAWVVSDRHLPSSLVYQGVVRGVGVEEVERLNASVTSRVCPDTVVVLDVPDAVAAARRKKPADRLEAEGSAFHAGVRAAYRELAPRYGWLVVDGAGTPEEVAARVWDAVWKHGGT
jgi:dTMP kinase